MKYLISLLIAFMFFPEVESTENYYTGKIQYKISALDLEGNDITHKMKSFTNHEVCLSTDGSNFKLANSKGILLSYYNDQQHAYFRLDATGKAVKTGFDKSSGAEKVENNGREEVIAGAKCQQIHVQEGSEEIVCYYASSLHTKSSILNILRGKESSKMMEATQNGVPVKVYFTDKDLGVTWKFEATKIEASGDEKVQVLPVVLNNLKVNQIAK